MPGSLTAIYGGIAANVAVAITKLAAAAATGSSGMLSEGIHSIVDTADSCLLLLGKKRSARPADRAHPMGHAHELYFWTFVVAVMIFTTGGAVSVYEGQTRMMRPSPLKEGAWNYVVLGIAAVFDGGSLVIGWKQFRREHRSRPFWDALRRSKDPTVFTVVLEDVADLIGMSFAAIGIFLSHRLHNPAYDGAASIAIGCLLMAVSILLVRESMGLLTGESAEPEVLDHVQAIAQADEAVVSAARPLTFVLGPCNTLLTLKIQFDPRQSAGQLTEAIDRIKHSVRSAEPCIKQMFIEPEYQRLPDAEARAVHVDREPDRK